MWLGIMLSNTTQTVLSIYQNKNFSMSTIVWMSDHHHHQYILSMGPPILQQWDDITLSLSHERNIFQCTLHQTRRTTRLYTRVYYNHSTLHCIIKRKYVADSTGDPLYFYSIEFCYTQYPSIEQSMGDIISQNARSRTANMLSVC